MKLGFVSAILPEFTLEQLLEFGTDHGFSCVEVMCWPRGVADRRYAGVTHLDVGRFGAADARRIRGLLRRTRMEISALGYYPNPLCANEREAEGYLGHLRKVISAAGRLGVPIVNTFIGREPGLPLEENWKLFDRRWPGMIEHAERSGVRIGIENCPMYFTRDEWPGGKNLAVSPAIWREMFRRIPSAHFGLNYDPSHAVWQFMDCCRHVREFAGRLVHVHAKDARVYPDRLDEVGILACPLEFHQPKLPGLGQVPWGGFFAALTDVRYEGPICIEVEDRAFEGSLADRQRALLQARRFLEAYL